MEINNNIKLKYGNIPDEMFEEYLKSLIGKLYKTLCMREDAISTLHIYLESFLIELSGNKELILLLKSDSDFLVLLSILEYFNNNPDEEVRVYKREMFKCIDIVKKMQKKYIDS